MSESKFAFEFDADITEFDLFCAEMDEAEKEAWDDSHGSDSAFCRHCEEDPIACECPVDEDWEGLSPYGLPAFQYVSSR